MNMIQIIKKAALDAVEQSVPTALLYGVVISVKPLKIQVDERLILPAEVMLLTSDVIDRRTKITFDNDDIWNTITIKQATHAGTITLPNGEFPANLEGAVKGKLSFEDVEPNPRVKNEITIYDGLKEGELVLLLRVQGGQKYVVIDRLVQAT